jgi:hypothetical protein
MRGHDEQWHQQHEKLVKFKQNERPSQGAMPVRARQDSRAVGCKANIDLTERDFWTKLASLRKMTDSTTCSGISNVKSWSNLNKRMAIVWRHKAVSKTSL